MKGQRKTAAVVQLGYYVLNSFAKLFFFFLEDEICVTVIPAIFFTPHVSPNFYLKFAVEGTGFQKNVQFLAAFYLIFVTAVR